MKVRYNGDNTMCSVDCDGVLIAPIVIVDTEEPTGWARLFGNRAESWTAEELEAEERGWML